MRRVLHVTRLGKLSEQHRNVQHILSSSQSRPQGLPADNTDTTAISNRHSDGSEPGKQAQSSWWLASAMGATALGTYFAYNSQLTASESNHTSLEEQKPLLHLDWVQQVASASGAKMVLSASTMHTHPLLKKDHLPPSRSLKIADRDSMQFSELHTQGMVEDLVCFYSEGEKRLDYIIQLGRNVCGFPRIVHGGLIAAIVDESFGFLWLSLRAHKQLTFVGPAFTAHLEIDYKRKIPAGSLVFCKTQFESCEGRKLWMKATVTDGATGKVYATARALFVCPRKRKLVEEAIKYAYNQIFMQ